MVIVVVVVVVVVVDDDDDDDDGDGDDDGEEGDDDDDIGDDGHVELMAMMAMYVGSCSLEGPKPPCERRSEERRVGKECRSRWSPYH